MSRLILVRHAQASFFAEDYDQLSELGERQAEQLADFWLRRNLRFDAVFSGPRVRHRRTAEFVPRIFHSQGFDCPDVTTLPAWDEHQVDRIITQQADVLVQQHPHFSDAVRQLRSTTERHERPGRFQRLFEDVCRLWVRDELQGMEIEPWPAFRARIVGGLQAVLADDARGQTIALFTSVGPITVALQYALGCSDDVALTTGWRVRNASVTEFVYSGDRFTLDQFNSLAHLLNPDEWTWR